MKVNLQFFCMVDGDCSVPSNVFHIKFQKFGTDILLCGRRWKAPICNRLCRRTHCCVTSDRLMNDSDVNEEPDAEPKPNVIEPERLAMEKTRVAVFGSFYRGFYLLNELLNGPVSELVTVVGVATDNPAESFISAERRVWQYEHTAYEEEMVSVHAQKYGIDVFRGRVNAAPFHETFESTWKPDLCVMGTFGQRIAKRLISFPKLGFYNLHPCIDDGWPSKFIGGNPFEALMNDAMEYSVVVMHSVDEGFDTGPFVAMTGRIELPIQTSVTDMHKITAYPAAQLASQEIRRIISEGQQANG